MKMKARKTNLTEAPLVAREPSITEREVSLFRNGSNQALRIPKDLELPGEKALLRREGDLLIIRPAGKKSLADLLNNWAPLGPEDEFPEIEDLPPEPVDL